MKNIMKKVVSCLVILVIALCVTSCKSCKGSKYQYPSVVPTLSNPTETYVKIDNYTVTNQMMYHRLLQSYGLTALTTLIEQTTLADVEIDEAEYKEYLTEYIYGTADVDSLTQEEQDEAYEVFVKNMAAIGLETEEEWTDYYRNEYKKIQLALKAYKEELKADEEETGKPFVTDEDYEAYYESNYHGTVDIIFVVFDSVIEAKEAMKEAGIDTEELFGDWKNTAGEELTAEQIKEAFKEMSGAAEATTYTYDDLYKLSSTLAVKAYSIEDGEYTNGPLTFGNRYYLLLKTASTEPEKTLEEVKGEIEEELIKTSLSSYYIAAKALEALNDAELKIFDEGLEKSYVNQYNSIYDELGVEEFDAFAETTEENAKVVASFKHNGKTYEITADQLFAELTARYGNILVALLAQQYVILSQSSVYNYLTNEVLDSEKYNEFFEKDIAEYKEAFLAGEYEENGYPTEYGWENFLRDYFGVLEEKQLLANIDSSLYEYELKKFAEELYFNTEDDETAGIDYLVQQEMNRIYNEYFSGTVTGLKVYYDNDFNGIADEIEEGSTAANAAADLAEKLYTFAKDLEGYDTLAEKLAIAVKYYNMATESHSDWCQYKKEGLIVSVMSNTTYSYTSNQDDKLKEAASKLWNSIIDLSNEKNSTAFVGVSLDPGVRTIINSKVEYITATQFADKVDAVVTSDGAYKLIMVNATTRTQVGDKDGKLSFPTYEDYQIYLEDNDSDDLTDDVITLIKAYYTVAIANIANEGAVNDLCLTKVDQLINDGKVVFTTNNEANLAKVKELIANSYTKTEE